MPGPRVFELDEVNELVPEIERTLVRVDEVRADLKTLKIRIDALEIIWGPDLKKKSCPDRHELERHLADMKAAEEEFEGLTQRIIEMGGHIKGLEPALIDFYGVREGRLVFWCWRRGEDCVESWHHLDDGFAGRQRV